MYISKRWSMDHNFTCKYTMPAVFSFVSVHQLWRQKCFIIWILFKRPHMWNKLFYLLHSMRHCVTWLNSRWWLAACDRLMSRAMKYDTIAIELRTSWKIREWAACTERTAQGKDFELILTVKMETRHPVEGSLTANFQRSVIIAELWRFEVARPGNFVSNICVFWQNDLLW